MVAGLQQKIAQPVVVLVGQFVGADRQHQQRHGRIGCFRQRTHIGAKAGAAPLVARAKQRGIIAQLLVNTSANGDT